MEEYISICAPAKPCTEMNRCLIPCLNLQSNGQLCYAYASNIEPVTIMCQADNLGCFQLRPVRLSPKTLQHISSSYNIAWMLFQHVILHKLTFWWAVQFTEYIDMFGNLLSHFSFHFLWYKIMVYRHIECVLVLRSSIKINSYSIFTDILLDIFIISVNTWYAPSLEKLHHSV